VRLRPELAGLALLALLCAAPAVAATESPDKAQVDRAVEIVKADPDLSNETTIHALEWDDDGRKKERARDRSEKSGWLSAIADFFGWIAESSRMLLWLLLAGLAALLVTFIVRVVASNRIPSYTKGFIAPTHVQDLDIRPESLPADIGAAARALWDSGQQRAALALLYRGLMSRLAHEHGVPIRDSSTEGDCLKLAALVLDANRTAYVTQLVRTWQRAIYGGLTIDTAVVHELCAGFAQNLDAPRHAQSPRRAGFAESTT
jgi:Domain of unknown function (DUF4129)